ncbi:HmuY family protein [Peijinzhouia sedimentorum]
MYTKKFNVFNIRMTILLFTSLFMLSACENDPEDETPIETIVSEEVRDLPALSSSEYTFYNLRTNQEVSKADSASSKWDIAFAGTTIRFNGGVSGPGQGGATMLTGTFESISSAPATGIVADSEEQLAISTSAETSWYNYTGQVGNPPHAVIPIPGRIIVFKTADGKYGKLEIESYYQGTPTPDYSDPAFVDLSTRPASRYYNFRYIVQQDGSTSFE